jgi:hypothetical protein
VSASGVIPRASRRSSSATAFASTPTETARPAAACARAIDSLVDRGRGVCPAVAAVAGAAGDLVEITRVQPALQLGAIDVGDQTDAAVHGDRQRLRAAHAAAARGHHQPPREAAAEVRAPARREGLVGPLHDPLRADVDPRAGRHLAEHDQAPPLEIVEAGVGRPVRHQVRVGDQDARRVLVGAQHDDRLPRLDQQRLVRLERAQDPHDGIERLPRPRRPPPPAVDHQVRRILGDLGVEVVHQHAQRRLGVPGLAAAHRPARRPNQARRLG